MNLIFIYVVQVLLLEYPVVIIIYFNQDTVVRLHRDILKTDM